MKDRNSKRLTVPQALLLRELSRFPGAVVEWPILADAIGVEVNRAGNIRVASIVGTIRRKFGKGVILNANRKGYYIPVAEKVDRLKNEE